MVNTKDFTNRLGIIMEYYSLSASSFAEKVGVQRSSISHILSGRNKPSLEFVMKVLSSFPEVDLYWLLNGKGEFPKSDGIETKTNIESTPEEKIEIPISKNQFSNSEIERIVVFYKNGSFKNFENN